LASIKRTFAIEKALVEFWFEIEEPLLRSVVRACKAICYFSDSQRREQYTITSGRMRFCWPSSAEDRYCNLLLLEEHHRIAYSSSLVFPENQLATYNDAILSSKYLVTNAKIQVNKKWAFVRLNTDRSVINSSAVFQTNLHAIPVEVVINGNELSVEFTQMDLLHEDMWMLFFQDDSAKNITRACFYAQ